MAQKSSSDAKNFVLAPRAIEYALRGQLSIATVGTRRGQPQCLTSIHHALVEQLLVIAAALKLRPEKGQSLCEHLFHAPV